MSNRHDRLALIFKWCPLVSGLCWSRDHSLSHFKASHPQKLGLLPDVCKHTCKRNNAFLSVFMCLPRLPPTTQKRKKNWWNDISSFGHIAAALARSACCVSACTVVLWACVCVCRCGACVTCIWVSCATEHEGFEVHTHTDTHSQAVGRSAEEGLKAWQREKSVWRRGKHQWWCNLRSREKSKKKGNASFWSDAV